MIITNCELINEINKPGAVCVPVALPKGVTYIRADKADLVALLWNLESDAPAPWKFDGYSNGQRKLVVQKSGD